LEPVVITNLGEGKMYKKNWNEIKEKGCMQLYNVKQNLTWK